MVPRSIRFIYLLLASAAVVTWLAGFVQQRKSPKTTHASKLAAHGKAFSPHKTGRRNPHKRNPLLAKISPDVSLTGQVAPKFSFVDLQGRAITAGSHGFRGRWLLLNFWASWCPPCVKEMPDLEKLARKMHQAKLPITLMAASTDTNLRIVKRFINRMTFLKGKKSHMRFMWDPGAKYAKQFGTFKYPETYLINPKGQVVDKFIGIKAWNAPMLLLHFQKRVKQFSKL